MNGRHLFSSLQFIPQPYFHTSRLPVQLKTISLEMKKVELVFIPSPGLSHLVSTVEVAKLLLARDHCLSTTVLILKFPKDNSVLDYTAKISSGSDATPRLRFLNLPEEQTTSQSGIFPFNYIDSQIDNVRQIVSELVKQPSVPSPQLAGLVLDMFCTKFIQVADEFSIPSYVFYTSGACCLGLTYDLLSLKYEQNQDLKQYKNSDAELSIRCFSQPLPAKVLPSRLMEEGPIGDVFLDYFKRIVETKGIMVNTFYELESYAIQSLLSDCRSPKVYPVGPILNLNSDQSGHNGGVSSSQSFDDIMKWLDDQPKASVVFLCFGTMGSFDEAQAKEIATALENSGCRFLWSLRKPGQRGTTPFPVEYENFEEVLPEGFLERTKGVGKVIGWAPQVAVLAHPAVGGFVSHCGWNSTLESVWFGVPMATFPMFAEQQLNAFMLVKELGMAEAIRIDYKRDLRGETPPEIVGSEEIEAAIRRLMAAEEEEGRGSGVRRKLKEMQRKSRTALEEGGSSYEAQALFIEDVIKNIG